MKAVLSERELPLGEVCSLANQGCIILRKPQVAWHSMQARGQQAPLVTIPGEADAVAVKNHVPCVEVSVRNLLRFQEQHRLEDLFAVPAPR